jgi:hypothetical protein
MEKKSWLELATHNERKGLTETHACSAADGYRMHIENDKDVCLCGNDKIHEGFDRVIGMVKDAPFCFAVSRQYLIDALSGINPDGRVIVFFAKPGSKSPVVIQDPDGERTAIIMPMSGIDGVEKPQNLPRVASENPKERPNRYQVETA